MRSPSACLLIWSTFIVFSAVTVSTGQVPSASPTPEDDVVKITTKLVQVDAVVTDKNGNHVTNLKADDFRVLQDGKPQAITGVTYVSSTSRPQTSTTPIKTETSIKVQAPPARLRSTEGGRIMAFVVDDGSCLASTVGVKASREGIVKFINEQMLPTDRVAIYRTGPGASLMQQFTNDRSRLLSIASKIRWYPPTGSCATLDGSFNAAARTNTFEKMGPNGSRSVTIESEEERKRREAREDLTQDSQSAGTIGILQYVVSGMSRIPGRKVLFLMSDGLPTFDRSGNTVRSLDALRILIEKANRATVVVNTIDSRGLFDPGMIEARDEVLDTKINATSTERISSERAKADRTRQYGLADLAAETGGKFYRNSNYLDHPVGEALKLEKGYYLLAYEPEEETFKGKKFNKIEIKVTDPQLNVHSRSGFVGISDEELTPARKAGNELYQALIAPIPQAGLDLQLTAYYVNSVAGADVVRSLVHIRGEDLVFTNDVNGMKKAVLDVVAVTMSEKNEVVDEFTREHTVRVDAAALPEIKRLGLVYAADVPIKKPGNYTFRVAIRDNGSRLLGTSGREVQIPDMRKRSFLVSGMIVAPTDTQGKFTLPGSAGAENAISVPLSPSDSAIRRFNRGAIVAYAYSIYNAKLDRASGRPKLSIQTNLYRGGTLVNEGTPQPADLQAQGDWSRIHDYSYLKLGAAAEPGDYALQIIVKDLLSSDKDSVASQWIDFEVVD